METHIFKNRCQNPEVSKQHLFGACYCISPGMNLFLWVRGPRSKWNSTGDDSTTGVDSTLALNMFLRITLHRQTSSLRIFLQKQKDPIAEMPEPLPERASTQILLDRSHRALHKKEPFCETEPWRPNTITKTM